MFVCLKWWPKISHQWTKMPLGSSWSTCLSLNSNFHYLHFWYVFITVSEPFLSIFTILYNFVIHYNYCLSLISCYFHCFNCPVFLFVKSSTSNYVWNNSSGLWDCSKNMYCLLIGNSMLTVNFRLPDDWSIRPWNLGLKKE